MSTLKPRPSFFQFRDMLLETIVEKIGPAGITPDVSWLGFNQKNDRMEILKSFKDRVEKEFGVEMLIDSSLADLDTTLEGLANAMHHTFSTVHLMERINQKVRNRLN